MSVYYVSTSGNDSASGTSLSSPWRTGQKAANVAVAGDTIYFRDGSYAGFTVINSGNPGNYITFKNYGTENVIIDAQLGKVPGTNVQDDVINLSNRSYIIIDGFNITGNTAASGTHTGRAHVNVEMGPSSFIILQNCKISFSWGTGIGIYNEAHDIIVQGCRIFENAKDNFPRGAAPDRGDDWGAGMIAFHGCYNILFKDNLIYWNHGEGVTAGDHSHDVVFDGNVCADNWSVNLYASDGSQNVTVKNNIVYTTSQACAGDSSTGTALGCGNPSNNNCCPDSIVLTSGDSSSSYAFGQRNLTGIRIFNNVVIAFGRALLRYNHEAGHPDSDWVIANNTFVLRGSVGVGVKLNGADSISNFRIQNNIITVTPASFMDIDPAPSGSVISNNLYNGSGNWLLAGNSYGSYAAWAAAAGEINSGVADPLLVNAAVALPVLRTGDDPFDKAAFIENFKLQGGSPAIDAAVALPAYFTEDINGFLRG